MDESVIRLNSTLGRLLAAYAPYDANAKHSKINFHPNIDTGSYMAFSKRTIARYKMDRVSAELKRRQSGHSVSPSVLPQFHPRLRRTTGLDYVHKNWAAGRNQKEESTVGPDIGQTAGHPITEVNLSLNFPSNLREG